MGIFRWFLRVYPDTSRDATILTDSVVLAAVSGSMAPRPSLTGVRTDISASAGISTSGRDSVSGRESPSGVTAQLRPPVTLRPLWSFFCD